MWNRIVLAAALFRGFVWASSCETPVACQAAGQAQAIFIRTALDARAPAPGSGSEINIQHVRVERVFKGTASGTIEIASMLPLGERFLIYATVDGNGSYFTGWCSRTRAAQDAADDIAFLEQFSQGKGDTRVSGVVSFGFDPATTEEEQRSKLAGVPITLSGEAVTLTALTDTEGFFTFNRLAPGKYEIHAEKDGYRASYWDADRFNLEAGACDQTTISMRVDRRIEGVVRDPGGQPVAGARVVLEAGDGRRERSFTDEEGRYTFDFMVPGSYAIGVNLHATPTAESPFAPVYYPNAAASSRAIAAKVSGSWDFTPNIWWLVGRG